MSRCYNLETRMVLILFALLGTAAHAGYIGSTPGHRMQKPRFQNQDRRRTSLFAANEEKSTNSAQVKAIRDAEKLRLLAKQMMTEAKEAEAALRYSKSAELKKTLSETDVFIDKLFAGNSTALNVAENIRTGRWSQEQLLSAVERLFKRRSIALGSFATANYDGFQIGDVRNSAVVNSTEWQETDERIQTLVDASFALDEIFSSKENGNSRWPGRVGIALETRLKDLQRSDDVVFQRKLETVTSTGNREIKNASNVITGYMQQTLGQPDDSSKQVNMTQIMEKVAKIPMWVPSSLVPFVLVAREKLDPDDVSAIRNDVLVGTDFFCTKWESIPGAAIYRGNIRSSASSLSPTSKRNESALVFESIQQRLVQYGISNRIQLFLLEDPEWRPNKDKREPEPRPVILALPKAVKPEQAEERGETIKIITGVSTVLTLVTTFAYSIAAYALNPDFFESVVNQNDYKALITGFPIFLGVLALQAIHEISHFLVAKRSEVKIGFPVPIPSLQLGTFGCITPLRSFPPNRSVLLDLALSGPVVMLLLSVGVMSGGVYGTLHASANALARFPVIPAALLKSSFLTGSLMSILAPKTLLVPLSQPIPIHPLFVVGFSGLISSAVNLLPIGRLDGGRACSAVFGARFTLLMSFLTLTLMAILAISGSSSISIFWGAIVVLLQRQVEIPVRNDVTEVDDVRCTAYVVALSLALLALAPFPGGAGFL